MSLGTMHLGDMRGFYTSRKVGTGGRWVLLSRQQPMATVVLGCREGLVVPDKPFLSLFLHNRMYKICSSRFIGV